MSVDLHIAATAELDRLGIFDTLDFPGESFAQPGIGLLNLVAVFETLVEHPVLVADAIADDRQRQRGAAVEEAGSETTEAAVAKARVMFAFAHILEIQPDALQGFARLIFNAEIQESVAQQAPHQEFER